MTRATTCTECGKKVYVYTRTSEICEECTQRIFAELDELGNILEEPSPEEDEVVYGSPQMGTSMSEDHLIKDEFTRKCLKCSRDFIALGKFHRICDACKETHPYKDEPVTIY